MRSYYNRDLQWRALPALPDQVVWRSSVHLGYARATSEDGRTLEPSLLATIALVETSLEPSCKKNVIKEKDYTSLKACEVRFGSW
ncbi:hypothetical protein CKAN_00642400 [Cinnamomum micranthum f. kanehirae]|uniref:Uncharacterized protein n=1 Tax=Cinnamomum micranthum f. kanehirae TaxID=337451 RepID=A0A3S3Q288_9MAGN|nr:hypothetical protein CKAN_00642400 [Cinnamomum micranthum f. kanehirae]